MGSLLSGFSQMELSEKKPYANAIDYKLKKYDNKLDEVQSKLKMNEEQVEMIMRKTGYQ